MAIAEKTLTNLQGNHLGLGERQDGLGQKEVN